LEHSKYIELDAATKYFSVTSVDSNETILQLAPITFLSENNYSIIFSGAIGDLTSVEFNAIVYRETGLE